MAAPVILFHSCASCNSFHIYLRESCDSMDGIMPDASPQHLRIPLPTHLQVPLRASEMRQPTGSCRNQERMHVDAADDKGQTRHRPWLLILAHSGSRPEHALNTAIAGAPGWAAGHSTRVHCSLCWVRAPHAQHLPAGRWTLLSADRLPRSNRHRNACAGGVLCLASPCASRSRDVEVKPAPQRCFEHTCSVVRYR